MTLLNATVTKRAGWISTDTMVTDYSGVMEALHRVADIVDHPVDAPAAAAPLGHHLWGHPMHVGIIVAAREMLHTLQGPGSCVERYDGMLWRRRLDGLYRHQQLINDGQGGSS